MTPLALPTNAYLPESAPSKVTQDIMHIVDTISNEIAFVLGSTVEISAKGIHTIIKQLESTTQRLPDITYHAGKITKNIGVSIYNLFKGIINK